jgi:hypothetical protein
MVRRTVWGEREAEVTRVLVLYLPLHRAATTARTGRTNEGLLLIDCLSSLPLDVFSWL